MKKLLVSLHVFLFCLCSIFSAGDDNWFMAQTKSAPLSSITATSELIEAQYSGKYIYPPVNIVDGNLDNTWCESIEDGSGIGEAITIEFTVPVSFDEIQIVNGFAYKDYYKKNNRVKDIQITQVAKKHFQQKTYTLKDDTPTWQSIKFEYTQTAQTITLTIKDVYKGNKYDDTCLDDFRILYKGNVIPFENVDSIKKTQEENSKLMLSSNSKDFAKQFYSLFDLSSEFYDEYRGDFCRIEKLYLLADNKKDVVCIALTDLNHQNKPYIDFIENYIYCTCGTPLSSMEGAPQGKGAITQLTNQINENPDKDIVVNANNDWRTSKSYELASYRINVTTTIDYVSAKSSILIKLDGNNSIYLNGVHYTKIPLDTVFNLNFNWY